MQSPDQPAPHLYSASPVSPECRSKAHLQPETLRPHHWCAHQSPLAPRAGAIITFKMATLTYRALHGSASPYLASFTCVADMPHRRRLRSASTEWLDVPTSRRSTVGGRAFPAAGAKVWNGLPSDVTSASSPVVFKNRLKTYFFRCCYEAVWLWMTFPFPCH